MHRSLALVALVLSALVLSGATSASGQAPTVAVDQVPCLPLGGNAAVGAQVTNNQPETELRLYFRRLNDTIEDAYYVPFEAEGGGRFWSTFPRPADFALKRFEIQQLREGMRTDARWAAWWRAKELSDDRDPTQELDRALITERASEGKKIRRDWLREMDDVAFEDWLERQKFEPAEYYASLHDASGRELAHSPTRVASVSDDCSVVLTPEQQGFADNLEIGETASWQAGDEPFHWSCEGIASRKDPQGVKRGDEVCRACVVAWYSLPKVILPLAAGAIVVTGVVITDGDPPPASPIVP